MGFYTKPNQEEKKSRVGGQTWRWIATVSVSAIIGSAATVGISPLLNHSSILATAQPSSSSDQGYSGDIVNTSTSAVQVQVSDGITKVAKNDGPFVVAVVNYADTTDYFTQQTQVQESGVGSGVLFYKDSKYGYIVTNNHVVDGAVKLEAVLASGKHVTATLVGADPFTDLAVIKIPVSNVKNVTVAQFANSDSIQVGEPAIAIGTPMGLDFAQTVTAGIVSGKQRLMPVEEPSTQQALDYQNVIQTDAAINPGNSGGPLLNISGQVIGINSSKIAEQNFEGMGFAIPANEVQVVAKQIMDSGHAIHPALGFNGYSLDAIPQQYLPNTPATYGVYVDSVTSAAAQKAGLQSQDVIVAINGSSVQDMADLRTALFKMKPGEVVKLTVYRGSKQITLSETVGTMTVQSTGNN